MFSQPQQLLSGVPQGSVLGPFLFLLFVNDLTSIIQNAMKMFADDTKVRTRIKTENDQISLQDDLNQLDIDSTPFGS